MIKTFLSLISFTLFVYGSQQYLLVVADDFNATTAKLSVYEGSRQVFKDIDVNLGKKGLGWGIGLHHFNHNPTEPLKYEGDKRAPAGIFKLTTAFGYKRDNNLTFPFLYLTDDTICVDDSNSHHYNEILYTKKRAHIKSFERMLREDGQYEYGIVVAHNPQQQKERGSCIFLHVQKAPHHPTVGCTSMKKGDIQKIIKWLDSKKDPIFIQVPKRYLPEVYKLYPELKGTNHPL